MNKEIGTKFAAHLKELLGDEVSTAWLKYSPLTHDDTAVALAMDLFNSDTPLTNAQALYLSKLIAINSKTENGAKTVDWDAVLNWKEKYLSPPQIEALKNNIERTRLEEEMRKYRINVAKIER
jgi:hypothetical protein